MPEEKKMSCVEPVKGPLKGEAAKSETQTAQNKKEDRMSVKPGQPAPDFEASAFVDGGFKNIKLSDYKGQWVVICFYPGDFTFV